MVDDEAQTQPAAPLGRDTVLATGRTGPRYRLGNVIGAGGMGEVVAATDEQIGREVAIKRMKTAQASEYAMTRFFREASIQGRLDHPAIVPVHELGVDDAGRPYFTMKRLTGRTLSEHIARRSPRAALLRAFTDMCLAVEFAHARGVVHRDLKPSNIVLGEYGDVYVLDWGVAKVLDETSEDTPPGAQVAPEEPLTADGTVVGTPSYMSPEQLRSARDVDARTDVYALGCILYEILACERLRPGGRDRRFVPELDAAWLAATEPDRDLRLATARELGEHVQRFLDGDRDVATRKQLARGHLDAALAAFADGGPDARRTAMREAGQALALDPSLSQAAELVGRLMLEVPREVPPEVERELTDEDLELQYKRGRAALWGHLAYLPLIGMGLYAGAGWYVVALAAAVAISAGLIARDLRRRPRFTPVWIVIGSVTLIITAVGCMLSPLLVAPTLVAMVGMSAGIGSFLDSAPQRLAAAVVLVAAVLGPLVAESLGVLPRTMWISEGVLVFRPPGLAGPPGFIYAAATIGIVSVVFTAIALGRGMRVSERGASRQLHLQAWHLRQLVGARPS